MRSEIDIDLNTINFHPVLKDIENMFLFFILSRMTLFNFKIQNILKLEVDGALNKMLEKYNKWVSLSIEIKDGKYVTKGNLLDSMIYSGRAMAILLYETLKHSDYINKIEETEEFKFLQYIRNGSAHNNKLNLKYIHGKKRGNWYIEENEQMKWEGYVINRTMQDKTIFNNFISINDMFLLAKGFSDKLLEIDRIIIS